MNHYLLLEVEPPQIHIYNANIFILTDTLPMCQVKRLYLVKVHRLCLQEECDKGGARKVEQFLQNFQTDVKSVFSSDPGTWGPIYGSNCLSVTKLPDKVNRAIQGNMALQVQLIQPGEQLWNQCK